MNTTEYAHLFKVLMVTAELENHACYSDLFINNTIKHTLAQSALILELKQ